MVNGAVDSGQWVELPRMSATKDQYHLCAGKYCCMSGNVAGISTIPWPSARQITTLRSSYPLFLIHSFTYKQWLLEPLPRLPCWLPCPRL